MTRIFPIVMIVCATMSLRAQNFNYTVTTDSVAWNELNAQAILNSNNSAWDFSYKIPIGFTFNYLGRNFDSLTIETNGYVVFDAERNYALTAFSGLGDRVDSSGNHAVLGYELTGNTGNHILKIQYKDCGDANATTETQSWQIWLKENGNVEFHVGPGTLRTNEVIVPGISQSTQLDTTYTTTVLDSTQNFRIGLLNMNMDTETRGLFIGQNPSSPITQPVTDTYPETLYLDFVPSSGYRYTFSPSNQ